jgi:hypothetical protein
LDYPRHFKPENIFAIRTLFWWGNFFSITIHVSGKAKKDLEKNLVNGYSSFKKNGFYISIHEEEWQHHFEEENYQPVESIPQQEFEKIINEKSFVKIANKIELDKWEQTEEFLLESFKEIVQLISEPVK